MRASGGGEAGSVTFIRAAIAAPWSNADNAKLRGDGPVYTHPSYARSAPRLFCVHRRLARPRRPANFFALVLYASGRRVNPRDATSERIGSPVLPAPRRPPRF